MGLVMDFSIAENAILETHSKSPFVHWWFLLFDRKWLLDKQGIGKHTEKLIQEHDIDPELGCAREESIRGNLQRLILARELSRYPNSS